MPDNWSFVLAAYALAAVALLAYWRRLTRQEKDLERNGATARLVSGHPPSPPGSRSRVE